MELIDLDAPIEFEPAATFRTDYPEEIPPLLRNLSYSSTNELNACQRKFLLNRLRSTKKQDTRSVTFAFGHAVGQGIQSTLEDKTEEQIILDMFLAWDYGDIYGEEEKANKSFWTAIQAVQRFTHIRNSTLLSDYELLFVDGRPAVELSFRITAPDGFRYRGFVDVVLRNKSTGELLVLELKTTSATNIDPAQYKNSGQALGYSVVLDRFAPGKSSYRVLYLILSSKTLEYTPMEFTKSYLQRAEWIHTFLIDIEYIKMLWEQKHFPQRGSSCYDFFRQCEHFNTCNLNPLNQVPAANWEAPPADEEDDYTIELTLMDLIDSQLDRT